MILSDIIRAKFSIRWKDDLKWLELCDILPKEIVDTLDQVF